MTTRRNWSEREQALIVNAWLYLLIKEKAGEKANKAALCRKMLPHLDNRTRGSYEMKLMNVSAAAVTLGLPIVTGYKPYGHAQKSLTDTLKRAVDELPADILETLK